jgi:outer membrane protein TolC
VALPSGSAPLPLLNPQQPGSGPTGPTSPSPIPDPGIELLATLPALPPLDLQPQWFETPASLRFDGRQILLETQANWAREQLKPQLTLRAAALLGNDVGFGTEIPPGWGSGLAQDNHQWGITFSYPLLTRDARAKVRLANIQLQRWSWEQQDAHRRWSEQIRAQHAALPMRQQASSMSREAAEAAGRLLQGEQLLFEAGESSLFLLLQRENNWIEAQRSAIQAWSQWQLARREWIWRWEGGF